MTAADPLAAFRPVLDAELRRAVDAVHLSHAALLREHLDSSTSAASSQMTPALLCLLTADALGVKNERAFPAAASIALLASMGRLQLETHWDAADAGDGLAAKWGLPRTLNAADGLYALAQASLLHGGASLDDATRLRAVVLLYGVCRDFMDELHAAFASDDMRRGQADRIVGRSAALLGAGVSLGALFAGASSETVEGLGEYGRSLADGSAAPALLDGLGLPDGAASRLKAAGAYVRRGGS